MLQLRELTQHFRQLRADSASTSTVAGPFIEEPERAVDPMQPIEEGSKRRPVARTDTA